MRKKQNNSSFYHEKRIVLSVVNEFRRRLLRIFRYISAISGRIFYQCLGKLRIRNRSIKSILGFTIES
jgi:hypothetical protein